MINGVIYLHKLTYQSVCASAAYWKTKTGVIVALDKSRVDVQQKFHRKQKSFSKTPNRLWNPVTENSFMQGDCFFLIKLPL